MLRRQISLESWEQESPHFICCGLGHSDLASRKSAVLGSTNTPTPTLHTPPPSLTPTKHPPVILLFKITDGDDPGATAHGELVLIGGPAHTAGSSVDPQDDQCRLPRAALQRPHIGIAVCAAGHNAVTLRGPVDACRVGSEDTG